MLRALRIRLQRIPLVQRSWRRRQDRRAARAAGTTSSGRTPVRLLIGPVNSAGQGYAWARAAERLPGVSASDFMYRTPQDVFAYPADHVVDTVLFRTNGFWRARQRRAVLRRFTHVIVESGRHLFGTDGTVSGQLDMMTAAGIRVALLFHGSDIRRPSAHAQVERDSPFHAGGYDDSGRLEEITARNHALADAAGLPVFVSTPDLLGELPGAEWLPVVVDVDRWGRAAKQPPLSRERPIVVHAPSNSGLKGSALVAPALRRLDEEGLIEYREIHGVPADRMPSVYGDADIVLDQFSLGIYGVATCEAMAAGRVVISHVAEQTRRIVRERTGLDLPVVQARADELEALLREVVADPAPFVDRAARGPAFVREVHDGRRSADALRGFLGIRSDPPFRSDVGH
ncbi:hypothetical protein GCM10009775_18510 [Microbacterium aoyamense]|uniref:Glycosyltransferase n=1 Tax=Microbacterium aoyamense TaxID=344166 RepID=A0ABN2PPC2_9MICO|nr:hypothetical protein [Microbacterium aoyamense]